MWAVWALRLLSEPNPRPTMRPLLNGDEETGGPFSRPHIGRLAEQMAATLVREPAAGPDGAPKAAREGVGLLFEAAVDGV
ncbi:hypothetical protein ACW4TU_08390 [Streptomyces sp. QTS52]